VQQFGRISPSGANGAPAAGTATPKNRWKQTVVAEPAGTSGDNASTPRGVCLDDLVGALPGVPDDAGNKPPSTIEEARQAGVAAARAGMSLHEIVFTAFAQYPGSARGVCELVAAAAKGRLGEQPAARRGDG
jgi:hypothetical protein